MKKFEVILRFEYRDIVVVEAESEEVAVQHAYNSAKPEYWDRLSPIVVVLEDNHVQD